MAPYGSAARKTQVRPPVLMTFEDYESIRNGLNTRRSDRKARDRERRMKYYRRQKLFGAIIMAVGAAFLGIGCCIDEGIMQYFGAVVGVAGLYIIVTKQMVLVDKYYLEYHDRINEY